MAEYQSVFKPPFWLVFYKSYGEQRVCVPFYTEKEARRHCLVNLFNEHKAYITDIRITEVTEEQFEKFEQFVVRSTPS